MDYREAKEYCAMLMVCRKGIDKAIQKFRDKATRKKVKMLRELYADFDPESDKLFKDSQQEIPWVEVQWGTREDKFNQTVVNCFQMQTNCEKIWWIGKVVVMLQADEEGDCLQVAREGVG